MQLSVTWPSEYKCVNSDSWQSRKLLSRRKSSWREVNKLNSSNSSSKASSSSSSSNSKTDLRDPQEAWADRPQSTDTRTEDTATRTSILTPPSSRWATARWAALSRATRDRAAARSWAHFSRRSDSRCTTRRRTPRAAPSRTRSMGDAASHQRPARRAADPQIHLMKRLGLPSISFILERWVKRLYSFLYINNTYTSVIVVGLLIGDISIRRLGSCLSVQLTFIFF